MTSQFKTVFLLVLLSAIIIAIGGMIGGRGGVIIAFIFALIMNVGSYWYSDSIVLRAYNARELAPEEAPMLHQIVEDLMFLARADSGAMLVQREAIDLTYLIRVITEKMAPLAAKKAISISNDLEEDLTINGDEKQITQLLIILLDNAIKYSGEKTVIQLTAKKTHHGLSVEVIDQGIGIPKDEINRVTQRFYRVDKARSRTEGGTGLGLSIASWIVDEHQAGMIIESEENEGTKIILNFSEGGDNK